MKKLVACSAGIAVALIGGQQAFAQDSSEGLQLEEIVVTAEKREVDLQKTAISIQVTSGEELKKQGKKRIDEIMSGTVGVQMQDSQVGEAFSIRGVSTGVGGAPGTNPGATVAVLVDGVYQNRGEVVRGGTLDVAQVEVMRGTQTTNVGASALAGAVSLVSNQPVFNYVANGSIEVGNYNKVGLEGVMNMPVSDSQAVRLAYSQSKRDGYLSSNAGNEDLQTVRGKYRWQVNDDLNAIFTVERQAVQGNGVSASVLTYSGYWEPYNSAHTYDGTMGYPATFGHVDNGVTYKDRSNPWDDGYPADMWPNNPFRNTVITSYTGNVDWNTSIGKLTVIPAVQHAHFRSQEPPRGGAWMGENRIQDTRQIEVRLASNNDDKLQWQGGAYYYYTNLTGTNMAVLNPGASVGPDTCTGTSNCYQWSNDKEGSTLTKSLYASANYSVTDAFRLLGSLRYQSDKKVSVGSNGTAFANGTITGPTCDYASSACAGYNSNRGTWNALTYRAGVEYDVLPDSMVYATYATGYQPGVADAMATTPSAKNETKQITLGIKNKFLDNRMQLNAEAFRNDFKNRPFTDPLTYTVPGSTDNCNAGPGVTGAVVGANLDCFNPNLSNLVMPVQRSQGLDLDMSYLLTAADRIDAAFEYLDSTYGSNPNAPVYTAAQVLAAANIGSPDSTQTAKAAALAAGYNELAGSYKGVVLQNSPKYSGTFTYEHTFRFVGGSSLAPKVTATYKDKYWAQGGGPAPASFTNIKNALDSGSIVRQDAYTLFDAYSTWASADGKFTVTGYVKNIANKAVQSNISGESGLVYISLDNPRTFGLILNGNF
jgi:iron complex outermembrane recepter protein